MQLLKQASRRRGGNSTSTSSAAAASTLPGASTPGGSLEMAIARLARGTVPSHPVTKPGGDALCTVCGGYMCHASHGAGRTSTQLAQVVRSVEQMTHTKVRS